jgi:hypothetical protein
MRGWLAANLFLLGMIAVAAGLWYLSVRSIRAIALPSTVEQVLVGFVSIACVVAAALFGREVLRAFGARRAR